MVLGGGIVGPAHQNAKEGLVSKPRPWAAALGGRGGLLKIVPSSARHTRFNEDERVTGGGVQSPP